MRSITTLRPAACRTSTASSQFRRTPASRWSPCRFRSGRSSSTTRSAHRRRQCRGCRRGSVRSGAPTGARRGRGSFRPRCGSPPAGAAGARAPPPAGLGGPAGGRAGRGGARLYAPRGVLLAEDEVLRQPGLVAALDVLRDEGAASVYSGTIARVLLELVQERGGAITAADLAAYEARWTAPVEIEFAERRVLTRGGLSGLPETLAR